MEQSVQAAGAVNRKGNVKTKKARARRRNRLPRAREGARGALRSGSQTRRDGIDSREGTKQIGLAANANGLEGHGLHLSTTRDLSERSVYWEEKRPGEQQLNAHRPEEVDRCTTRGPSSTSAGLVCSSGGVSERDAGHLQLNNPIAR